MIPIRDVDFQVAYIAPFSFWRWAKRDVNAARPTSLFHASYLDECIAERCNAMELITYGCLDARLP